MIETNEEKTFTELLKGMSNYNFLDLKPAYIVEELKDDIIVLLRNNSGKETLRYRNQIELCEEQDEKIKKYTDTCGNQLLVKKIKILVDFDDDYFDNAEMFTLKLSPFKCKIKSETNPDYCKDGERILTKAWREFMNIQYGDAWFKDFEKYIENRKNTALKRNDNNYNSIKKSLDDNYKENERLIDEKYSQQIDMLK